MRRLCVYFVILTSVILMGSGGDPKDRDISDRRADGGTDLHVAFGGLICHVFDDAHSPRAVIIRGTSDMPHRPLLTVFQSQIVSTDISLTCTDGECVLDLTDTALRFANGGRARYPRGGSFDMIVPHLRQVTNGEMRALRDDTFDEVPSLSSPMTSYFELPSGVLTATPLPVKAMFDPDFENRGLRSFPNGVFLNAHVPEAVLWVRRAGDHDWRAIRFRDDQLIDLRVVNEPTDGVANSMHAMLYYSLSKTPLSSRPMISMSAGGATPLSVFPGCSDTGWP